MLLLVDAGNSRITLALYGEGGVTAQAWLDTDALGRENALAEAWGSLGGQVNVEAVAIASVIPSRESALASGLSQLGLGPSFWVRPGTVSSIPLRYEQPGELGADRLANAEGAVARMGPEAIIVDLGTALTVDVVHGGAFQGGIIFPGRGAARRALSLDAEALPLEACRTALPSLLGRSTEGGIRSGLYHGYRGLVAGLVEDLTGQYGEIPVLVTGGGGEILRDLPRVSYYCPDLTLYGIACLWRRADSGPSA